MSIPEKILQAGCDAYAATFLNGNGSLGDGIEAAYLAIHGHDDWVRAGPPAWTGEGLPPVWTVCEYHANYIGSQKQYAECEIIAHFDGEHEQLAAYVFTQHDGTRLVGQGTAEAFRPLRTPEQIAAEAREKAINAMAEILTHDGSFFQDAERLYDAGYRKFEIVDGEA